VSIDNLKSPQSLSPHLSVVVPAYNEEERIGVSLTRMLAYLDAQAYAYEILVVDDGSEDATRAVVARVVAGRKNVRVLHYKANRGKGYAVRYGMLRAAGQFVLFCDADLATPIAEVEKLFAALHEGEDIAIGSRDTPGAKLERRQSLLREVGGKLFNQCVQLLAVPGIRDTQCGFKLFTHAAAQGILPRCHIDGFSFDVEVLYLGRQLGCRIAEIPVRWTHQEGSKVRFARDGWQMLRTLWRIRSTTYPNKAIIYQHSYDH
jgi:dolichyl-phosphate beta-glucosyltransferase